MCFSGTNITRQNSHFSTMNYEWKEDQRNSRSYFSFSLIVQPKNPSSLYVLLPDLHYKCMYYVCLWMSDRKLIYCLQIKEYTSKYNHIRVVLNKITLWRWIIFLFLVLVRFFLFIINYNSKIYVASFSSFQYPCLVLRLRN